MRKLAKQREEFMDAAETEAKDASGYNPKNAHTSILIKIHRRLWTLVNCTLFRYSPFFCYGWRRFLLRCFGAKIARTATVSRTAVINEPWNLTMGARSMICHEAWVMCYASVEIGEQALVGEYVKILTGGHVANSKSFKGIASSVIIGKDAWISTNAMLVSGGRRKLKIGDGAIIGAGAVVFTSVDALDVMLGNPAVCVGHRSFDSE